jgi:transposase
MARTKSGEAERKWRERVEACETSGLTVAAFARREGLSAQSLSAWKRRLRAAGDATSFVPVVVRDVGTVSRETFELVLREGAVLRIPPDFDEVTLGRLVRALGASR